MGQVWVWVIAATIGTTVLPTVPNPPDGNVPLKWDFQDPKIEFKIEKALGIAFSPGYRERRCKPVSKDDFCLPSGFLQAVQQGEAYRKLWEAELHMQAGQDLEADTLLRQIRVQFPKVPKVYWLMAKLLFFRAEKLPETNLEGKEKLLLEGKEWAKIGVELDPNNINTQLYYGTMVGRLATTKGVLNAAWYASDVKDAWQKAIETKGYYRFPTAHTAMGAVHYGMGVLYRVLPDSWWLSVLFSVRGNIDKSIQHIEMALETCDDTPELFTELVSSYLCKWERDDDEDAKKKAEQAIQRCLSVKPKEPLHEASQRDCERLRVDPSLACGYSRDRQQETDVSKLKRSAD
jgi:tetratricopeptide (TPR) repeat protein